MLDIVNPASAGSPIRDRAAVVCRRPCREILALDPGGPAEVSLLRDAADRGAVVRLLVSDPSGVGRHAGVTVRTAAAPPAGLVILDRSRALVTAGNSAVETDGNTAAQTVLVTDRAVVGLLCALFERIWADAGRLSDGLTDQQSATLRLLANGYTDEAIAKRLGVSARTVRRMVTGLMTRLGARGRFQAGARAVQAGWLTSQPATHGDRPANPNLRTTG